MHELSLAQALIQEVERIKTREKADSVVSVTLSIGALSGVDRESFEFIFPLAAEGTCLEGAALVIRETPARIRCEACGWEGVPDLAFFRCGTCGSSQVKITGGRDFLIESVQVQNEDGESDGAAAAPANGESHDV